MHLLPLLLIVSLAGSAPIDGRYPQAVEVYANGFEQGADRNYDDWPDEWTRRRGAGFPHYLPIQIAQEPSPEGQHCLQMSLDGGAAAAQSPAIEINPAASYVLEAYIRTQSLEQDKASAAIIFLDANRQPLETMRLPGVRDATEWRKVRLGPVATNHASARYAVIELSVAPAEGEDLRGAALFDDVWFARLPRMSIHTNRPYNLFQPGDAVEVICEVSGTDEEQGQILFELFDAAGREVARREVSLRQPAVDSPRSPSTRSAAGTRQSPSDQPMISWQPPLEGPGFYYVHVAMHFGERLILQRELTLAVIQPHASAGGEFGWSLSRGPDPVPLPELAKLVSQAGIGWIKFPLWLSEEELARGDELVRFIERLTAQRIEIVGMLAQPPAKIAAQLGRKDVLTAANIFTTEPEIWYPLLEPVLAQLSMKVRWWQLGSDEDTSFVGYPLLNSRISQVKTQMDRIGQDTRLGFGWSWLQEEPPDRRAAWRFLSMSSQPPLSSADLGNYLGALPHSNVERWVRIEPLDRDEYRTDARAADLTQRMIAAKKYGATRIFASQPFSTDRGLLNDDGTPGELLCPWLTTVAALSASQHLGSLSLPGGSSNEIFVRRGGDAVMFIWSSTPRRETLDMGSQLKHVDLFGRSLIVHTENARPTIDIGPMPTLVTGISEAVARTAQAFAFERDRFPSVLGEAHVSGVRLKNHFPRGASGKLRLIMPEGWQVDPSEFDFKLATGEEYLAPFVLRFPYDANSGSQEVRAEVQVTADRAYQFSIYRQMQIGLGDLKLEATTELADNGELLVHQRVTNLTDDELSFKCDLYATNRRRLRTQVLQLGRGEDVQTYRLPAGRELLGQMLWIRAEEVGGQRALSHRFRAEE